MPKDVDLSKFQTHELTLRITTRRGTMNVPEKWDWYDMLNIGGVNDNLSVVKVEEVEVDRSHVEQMEEE